MPQVCITCAHCGAEFFSHRYSRHPKYCSLACRRASLQNQVTFACANCGKSVTRKASQGPPRQICCSRACRFAHRRRPLGERFWENVAVTADPDACWLWTGERQSNGYGRFSVMRDKRVPSHVFAWIQFNGFVPEGLFICHSCDVPLCCNPSHLWPGTHRQNMDDMVSKGRGTVGELNGCAKLTAEDVLVIREQGRQGDSRSEIAARFGIKRNHVGQIIRRERWAHLR